MVYNIHLYLNTVLGKHINRTGALTMKLGEINKYPLQYSLYYTTASYSRLRFAPVFADFNGELKEAVDGQSPAGGEARSAG